ncbi:MAG: DUF2934 domain-containing protein [Thermodesulfovibrionales bacterium]|nr:DUF2934 domain-containing protein [Thermodesulfovibrionales bacterium]
MNNIEQEIKKVAEELYYKSGCIEGRDKENWFEAERIVMARLQAEAEKKQQSEEQTTASETKTKTKKSAASSKSKETKTTKTKKTAK